MCRLCTLKTCVPSRVSCLAVIAGPLGREGVINLCYNVNFSVKITTTFIIMEFIMKMNEPFLSRKEEEASSKVVILIILKSFLSSVELTYMCLLYFMKVLNRTEAETCFL